MINDEAILKKVMIREQEKDELIEQRNWEQRCVNVCICPMCGTNMKEDTVVKVRQACSWSFYKCHSCKYSIEVNNFKEREIVWRD